MLKIFKLKVVAAVAFTLAGAYSPAAGASSGFSRQISTLGFIGNYAYIHVNGAAITSGRPSCHTSPWNQRYAFDMTTNKGRALLAMAQAALLSGKSVNAFGTGTTCTPVLSIPGGGGTFQLELLDNLDIF